MKFTVSGHPNMQGTHKSTLEFTKDADVSLRGDCIVGVKADYDLSMLKKEMEGKDHVKVSISVDELSETFESEVNSHFTDAQEMVFRISNFASDRTLGVRCEKSSLMLSRNLMEKLKDEKTKATVTLEFY